MSVYRISVRQESRRRWVAEIAYRYGRSDSAIVLIYQKWYDADGWRWYVTTSRFGRTHDSAERKARRWVERQLRRQRAADEHQSAVAKAREVGEVVSSGSSRRVMTFDEQRATEESDADPEELER